MATWMPAFIARTSRPSSSWRTGARVLLVASATLLLTACVPPSPPPAPQSPSPVDSRLAASSARIATALETLERLQAAASPAPAAPSLNLSSMPIALRQPVTWTWTGPARAAIAELAGRVGYHIQVQGVPPVAPLIVQVAADRTPLARVFETIGLQLGARATLRLDPAHDAVDLFYTPPPSGAP